MTRENQRLYLLFKTVKEYVLYASGDGGGYIISENYEKYANIFEQYEKNRGNYFSQKEVNPEHNQISFGEGQEWIVFMKENKYHNLEDICVEIP
jgi:hypothetical protein